MAGAIAALIGWLAGVVKDEVTRALIWKVFLTSLLVVVLPLVLKNFILEFFEYFYQSAFSSLQASGLHPTALTLTGIAGWLASESNLPLCFSILIGALSTRFTLRLFRLG